jgi:peptidoglycan-associated lipoprotein
MPRTCASSGRARDFAGQRRRARREYNLGLGERRSNAVSGALGAAGASTAQLNVVSYGEERPVCKDHSEDCWQKNRRVEVVYTSKQ